MMSYINETDFVIDNKELVYPAIITDGLQLYYDAKGKRDTDYHRDTILDMSGNKNHGKLHNFAYEKHSGYKDGLVFDYIDDKLVRPALNLNPNDFTFMLNGNIISFSSDRTVKRVQDGEVIEVKEDIPNAQDLIDCIEYKGNILGDMENIIDGLYKTEVLSGEKVYTDQADDSVVHVEIDGKSYQHSGSGKNLFNKNAITPNSYVTPSGNITSASTFDLSDWIKIEPNKTYVFDVSSSNIHYQCFYDNQKNFISKIRDMTNYKHRVIPPTSTGGYVRLSISKESNYLDKVMVNEGGSLLPYEPPAPTPDYPIEIHSLNDFDVVSSTELLSEGQLEEYDYDTEYENIYRTNISLSEPLRSVGDVKDRLFRDSDGLWKIERNVEPIHPEDGTRIIEETYGVLDSPIYKVIPQELQDKLNNIRSFQNSNYVYTIVDRTNILPSYIRENLKPNLNAKFLYNNWYKEDRVINNLMIYNRALTNEEMLQNYKTIKRRWGM